MDLVLNYSLNSSAFNRLLEDGKVDEADIKKDEIEEFHRERRKELSKMGQDHVPRFFK